MGTKAWTVRRLANEAGLDAEELLIGVWDAGLERVDDADQPLTAADVARIRKGVGFPTPRQLRRPEYWRRALDLDDGELREILTDGGLDWRPSAKTLPEGSIRLLKKASRKHRFVDLPPLPPREPLETAPLPQVPPLVWTRIGRQPVRAFVSAEQVEAIHWALVQDFAGDRDPIAPPGVRDKNLLESAVTRQHTSLGETDKYPMTEMAAAALLHSLVLDHAFFNGNKRTALVAMLVFLDLNGLTLTCNEDTLFKLVLRLAQHQLVPMSWPELPDREVALVANWIDDNSRVVEKGERPLQWRRLKHILLEFNCRWDFAPGVGNRLNIVRTIPNSGRWMRRDRLLRVQVKFPDDGREANKVTIHEIRRALELDDEHGIDSASFYGDAGRSIDEFITRYRKLLQRLAKL